MVLQEVHRLLNQNMIPIIEGGSGFYLNYLLNSDDHAYEQEKWESAEKEAQKIVGELKYGDKLYDYIFLARVSYLELPN